MSVEVLNESGIDLDITEFVRLARFTLKRLRVHPEAELCLKLVDEPTIAEFNVRYLGKSGPTDVLSFPIDGVGPAAGPRELGDVVICREHTTDLVEAVVHGVLHLCGYDHETDDGEMLALQDRVVDGLRA